MQAGRTEKKHPSLILDIPLNILQSISGMIKCCSMSLELGFQERFELLVEPAEDTKVLLCWNADTVCLSFRGTASMTNVLADLQVALHNFSTIKSSSFFCIRFHS